MGGAVHVGVLAAGGGAGHATPRRVAGEVAAVSLAFITQAVRADFGDWRDTVPENHSLLWTKAEDDKLRQLYPDPEFTRRDVAREMGRTVASCDQRAQQIGVKRPVPPKKPKATKPPGPVPAEDTAGRAIAESQAEKIRAWYAAHKLPVEVAVVYVPGPSGYRGGWSAVIQTTVEISKR